MLLLTIILSCFLFSSCKKEEEYVIFGQDRNNSMNDIIFKTLKYHPIDEEGTVIEFQLSIETLGFKDIFTNGGYLEISIQARGELEEGRFNKKYTYYTYFFSKKFHVENHKIILKRQDIDISYLDFDIDICKDKYSTKENYVNSKFSYKIDTHKNQKCYVFGVLEAFV